MAIKKLTPTESQDRLNWMMNVGPREFWHLVQDDPQSEGFLTIDESGIDKLREISRVARELVLYFDKHPEESDRAWVKEFVGDELWEQIAIRIRDGQRRGEAVLNAGDHADQPWAWVEGWLTVMTLTDWSLIRKFLEDWSEKVQKGLRDV